MGRWFLLLLSVVVTACASAPVSDLGGGRYHLAVRQEHGPEGLDLDRENARHLADQYCRKSGQRAKIEGFDQQGPFVVSPSVGVVFSCVPPAGEVMPHHGSDQH